MTVNSAKDIISTDCLLHGSFMIKLIVKHFTPLKLYLAVLRVGEIYSYKICLIRDQAFADIRTFILFQITVT